MAIIELEKQQSMKLNEHLEPIKKHMEKGKTIIATVAGSGLIGTNKEG